MVFNVDALLSYACPSLHGYMLIFLNSCSEDVARCGDSGVTGVEIQSLLPKINISAKVSSVPFASDLQNNKFPRYPMQGDDDGAIRSID